MFRIIVRDSWQWPRWNIPRTGLFLRDLTLASVGTVVDSNLLFQLGNFAGTMFLLEGNFLCSKRYGEMAEREGCILYHHRRPGKRVKKKESPLGCGVNLLHLGEGDYMWAAGPRVTSGPLATRRQPTIKNTASGN